MLSFMVLFISIFPNGASTELSRMKNVIFYVIYDYEPLALAAHAIEVKKHCCQLLFQLRDERIT